MSFEISTTITRDKVKIVRQNKMKRYFLTFFYRKRRSLTEIDLSSDGNAKKMEIELEI